VNRKLLVFVVGLLLLSTAYAADKPDQKKLSDIETYKLQLAQKDLVIAQLQQQILQLSAQVVQAKETDAQLKMTAVKDEVTTSHPGMLVQFQPDGTPVLAVNPLKATAEKQPAPK
jgi:hypothetical protein